MNTVSGEALTTTRLQTGQASEAVTVHTSTGVEPQYLHRRFSDLSWSLRRM